MHTIGRSLFDELDELRALLRDVSTCTSIVAHGFLCGLCTERVKTALSREAGAGAREKLQELHGTPTDPARCPVCGREKGQTAAHCTVRMRSLRERADTECYRLGFERLDALARPDSARTPQEQPSPRSEPAK